MLRWGWHLKGEGLSVFEAMMLAAIFFEKRGEIKPLGAGGGLSRRRARGNVSHCISSLEAKGLVERRIDPEDARAFQLMLKPQGRRRAVRVVGILDRMQRGIEEAMGVARLEGMLGQMKVVEELCSVLALSAGDGKG